ncbi:MAG: SRPBCC family protein [Stellaceae bacterium]
MAEARDKSEERPAGRSPSWLTLARWSSAAGGIAIAARGLRRGDGLGRAATLGGAALAAAGAASALAGSEFLRRSGQSLLRAMPQGRIELARAVTINRPRAELYAFWRDPANLARLLPEVLEIRPEGEGRWHWAVQGPGGARVEWEAELVEDREDELIAWRSLGDADIAHEGTVRFLPAPGDHGSEVHVRMTLRAPAGRAVARLLGEEPGTALRNGLRRFQQQMETGEIATAAPEPADGHDRAGANL